MGARWVWLWSLCAALAGCSSEDTLRIDLRTDYRPGLAFDTVQVRVIRQGGGEPLASRELVALPSDDYLASRRIAQFPGLERVPVIIEVRLLLDARTEIASSRAPYDLRPGITQISVVISCEVDGDCVSESPDGGAGDADVPSPDLGGEPVPDLGTDAGDMGAVCLCGPDGRCDPATGACVECLEDAHCPGGLPCIDGTCGCLDESVCPGTSCDVDSRRCTSTPVGSVPRCRPCGQDSECEGDDWCVPIQLRGENLGNYCLPEAGSFGCPVPYRTLGTRTTSSGATGMSFCGPNPDHTSCEGVLGFGIGCGSAADCGRPFTNDSLCNGGVCTYGCDADRECVNDCAGSGFSRFCAP